MNLIKPVIRSMKKYKNNEFFKAKFQFVKYYEKTTIKEECVLIQSYDGSSISGSPYYILLELCSNENYKKLKKFVVAQKDTYSLINRVINQKKLENVEVVILHSKDYCRLLSECKYLINNSTFPSYFIKKDGQIYLNTWHGTPLKCMGRDVIDSPHEIGNTQRNFMISDYLLYPNEFTFDKMKSAFMLDNLYKGKYIVSGYPRNSAFFNHDSKEKIRKKLKLNNKKVIVYMPTWRGQMSNKRNEEQYINIMHMLYKLEDELPESAIMYVKLHNYVENRIDYEQFEKIKPFPQEYETYEFLNIADCLITDYSSVMFDFANTGKKIILYIYDYKKYTKNRGFYIDVENLPFQKVYNEEELCVALENLDKYDNYDRFRNEFCAYDMKESTKQLCELVFWGKVNSNMKMIDGKEFSNHKENVLIFSGALQKNGITAALKGLINNINLEKRNYYLTFFKGPVAKNDKYFLTEMPKELKYIPIQGSKSMSKIESVAQYMYFRLNRKNKWIKRKLKNMYEREIKRIYPNIQFDYAIDFCGYDKQMIQLLGYMNAYTMRFTHSIMQDEKKMKNNVHIESIKFAYETYDNIIGIRDGMDEEIKTLFDDVKPKKVSIVHNINDINTITKNAIKEVEFDENTYSNTNIDKINQILNNKDYMKFVNIARFSKEKGLDRLILAFEEYHKNDANSYLFLVGGEGKEFKNIIQLIEDRNIKNIIIIKNIRNPYPILKKADLFILSSYYEGLPMTIMEALILEIPVLSTNIKGPRKFLEQGYAKLVENSQEGLLKGMNDFKKDKFKSLKKFDAQEFNKKAIQEFDRLFK